MKQKLEEINSTAHQLHDNSAATSFFTIQCHDAQFESCRNSQAKAYFEGKLVRYSQPGKASVTSHSMKGSGKIILCHERLRDEQEVERILLHEMTHAHDYFVKNIDLSTKDGLACSEVRAAKAGECSRRTRSMLDKVFSNSERYQQLREKLQKRCVRSHAILSTNLVFKDQGKESVEKVFDACFSMEE